jgi:hypothetical protein
VSVTKRCKVSQLYLKQVKHVLGISPKTHTAIIWREIPLKPLEHVWLLRSVQFYNSLCDLPVDNLYRQIAATSCVLKHKFSWATGLATHLLSIGVPLPGGGVTLNMEPVAIKSVQESLAAQLTARHQFRSGRGLTYALHFARTLASQKRSILRLRLPAKHVRRFLNFRIGHHQLAVDRLCYYQGVDGTRQKIPRSQRLCTDCDLGVVGDERHFLFVCPALTALRLRFPTLFVRPLTLHAFVWHPDLRSVVLFVSQGLALLGRC